MACGQDPVQRYGKGTPCPEAMLEWLPLARQSGAPSPPRPGHYAGFGVHWPCGFHGAFRFRRVEGMNRGLSRIQWIGSCEGVTSMVFQGGFNAVDFFLGYNFTRTLVVGNISSAADTGIDRVASTAPRTGIRASGYTSDPILHRPIAAGGYRNRLERSGS